MITIYLKQYNKIVRNADVRLFDDLGYDDILWIDLLSPTIKEQKAVENFMEINLQTRQQVEEIESSSKYSETENAIICNSNFFMPTADTFTIEPVSFIIAEGVLVSVRFNEFRTFTESAKRLQMNYRAYPDRLPSADFDSRGAYRLRRRPGRGAGQEHRGAEQGDQSERIGRQARCSRASATCRRTRC